MNTWNARRASSAVLLAALVSCAPDGEAKERVDARRGLDEARQLLDQGEIESAIETLTEALRLAPAGDDELRYELFAWRGHAHMRVPAPEEALADLDAAVALDRPPAHAWPRYGRGTALREMGELEEALRAFGEAIELDPTHFKALEFRAELSSNLGRHEPSVEDATRALEIVTELSEPELVELGFHRPSLLASLLAIRGKSLDALGRHDEAGRDRARRDALLDG